MSNAIRRYSGELGDPVSVRVNVITEKEVPLSVEPQILNEYKRGEFIQTWNKTFFMTDLSNVDTILRKTKPETFGLTIFSNLLFLSIELIDLSSLSLIPPSSGVMTK